MNLIFIHGSPAVGKLTVARELAKLTGFRLFHNHLTVDLVSSIFDFGSEPFVLLREQIWLAAFAEAARNELRTVTHSGTAQLYGAAANQFRHFAA